jgi:hypothetical protein
MIDIFNFQRFCTIFSWKLILCYIFCINWQYVLWEKS